MKKVRTHRIFKHSRTMQQWRGKLILTLMLDTGMGRTKRRAHYSTTLLTSY
jgi:hypothetical protein